MRTPCSGVSASPALEFQKLATMTMFSYLFAGHCKHTGCSFCLFSSEHFYQRMHIFTGRKKMQCQVCFSSKADNLLFILLENTENNHATNAVL